MERIDVILLALAFALGFCIARVSLCTVATIRMLILERRATGVAGLALATSAAGLVLLLAAHLWPAAVSLPQRLAVTPAILSGGALLGLGALCNGGCYLGSVAYLGRGDGNYLFTLAGFFLCALWLHAQPPMPAVMADSMEPGLSASLGLALFGAVVLLSVPASRRAVRAHAGDWRRHWPWPAAAIAAGLCAGLLFAGHPNWSYSRLIDSLATARRQAPGWPIVLASGALFAGVLLSSALAGRFRWSAPRPLKALRCLTGGLIMGYGAAQIPGGNDLLLLWVIPGLALYGLAAYAAMMVVIGSAFLAGRLLSRATPM
jgi:uncharacterized protein